MFCIFTSECQKKSKKRTAAILDRYGRRIGRRTWIAELTIEAVDEIYKHLRRTASKNTSVACFKNKGYETMSLQWIVGNKIAYDHVYGAFSCGTKTRQKSIPLWVKAGMLLSACAGRLHDIGKDTAHFQTKLRIPEKIADSVRHEWISAHVLQTILDQRMDTIANGTEPNREVFIDHIQRHRNFTYNAIEDVPLDEVSTAHGALKFLLATHHRVFGPLEGMTVDSTNHVRSALWDGCPGVFSRPESTELDKKNLLSATRALERLEVIKKEVPYADAANFWKGMAIISRAALLLADHHVSTRPYKGPRKPLLANSKERQPLDWHLEQVGLQSAKYIRCFEGKNLPGLCPGVIDKILSPSAQGSRFAWQDELAGAIQKASGPALIFNVATTGAGKTRANLKCICALRDGEQVRVVAAFNLRTLTLQTFDEYVQQFGMSNEDAALLIGDSTTRMLHQATHANKTDGHFEAVTAREDSEEFTPEISGAETLASPEWLLDLEKNAGIPLGPLICSPCLVSTMDFIDDAGNLHRTARHPLALLRVATSDIIIDEADSFNVNSYPSILRLIELAGLFGRNVVMSSATLSEKLAEAAYRAWVKGCNMGAVIFGTKPPVTVLGSNFEPPIILPCDQLDSTKFSETYQTYMRAQSAITHDRKRIAKILPIERDHDGDNNTSFYSQIAGYIPYFHSNNNEILFGKSVSFGLIRIANVNPAMKLSEYLAINGYHGSPGLSDTEFIVCPYHARDLSGRRFYKEYFLDQILKCSSTGERHGIAHVKEKITSSLAKNVVFIVVATPVEEVGRDHDFDWAIIEPSSMHSVVQIAGRVNRHRFKDVHNPNIGILQFNLQGWRFKVPYFKKPGLQVNIPARGRDIPSHKSCDMYDLMKGVSSINSPEKLIPITANLCFGDNQTFFSKYDDDAIEYIIKNAEKIRDQPLGWASSAWLTHYRLRDGNNKDDFFYNPESQSVFQFSDKEICEKQRRVTEDRLESVRTDIERQFWLCPDINTILTFIESLGISNMPPQKSLGFSLYSKKNLKAPAQEAKTIKISWNGVMHT